MKSDTSPLPAFDIRTGPRFQVPGAVVSYRTKTKNPFVKTGEDHCPVLDISRGGLLFICQTWLEIDTKILLELTLPGEKEKFSLKADVLWLTPREQEPETYEARVRFFPYGKKRKQNSPEALIKIISLEKQFMVRPGDTQKKAG